VSPGQAERTPSAVFLGGRAHQARGSPPRVCSTARRPAAFTTADPGHAERRGAPTGDVPPAIAAGTPAGRRRARAGCPGSGRPRGSTGGGVTGASAGSRSRRDVRPERIRASQTHGVANSSRKSGRAGTGPGSAKPAFSTSRHTLASRSRSLRSA
jgi:hypothetical protein